MSNASRQEKKKYKTALSTKEIDEHDKEKV